MINIHVFFFVFFFLFFFFMIRAVPFDFFKDQNLYSLFFERGP